MDEVQEQKLRERLDSILELICSRADQQIGIAEDNDMLDKTRDMALGYGLGLRMARDVILGHFPEIYPDSEE